MDSTVTQYEVSDLVRYAYEGQPAKMQDVFNELMAGRIYDSIQQKKVEVAQSFFNKNKEEAELDLDTEEEDEDGENSQ
jgi:hypothetical protein